MAYDPTDKGSLFKNEDRLTEKHPLYKGEININGTEYWLAAWINKSKDGKSFMSLKATKKDKQPQAKPTYPQPEPQPQEDEDIPF
jgi:hypothetical protein